ncbi:hypothetical protein DFH28DRAFT_886188 [Melampsora americana]|nr:hypothetical protein DFH28DRAFT_886188 [Melampsora americana]
MYPDLHHRRSVPSLYGGSVSPREEILRAQMMRGGMNGSLYNYPMAGGSLYGPPMSRYGGTGGMYGGLGMCRPSSVMGMGGMGYGMGGMRTGMGYGAMGYGGMGMGGMGYGGLGMGVMGYGGYVRPYRTSGLVESRSPHLCRAKSWSAHARLF